MIERSKHSPLVFLHIPKTGGSSLGEYLSRLFPACDISPSINDESLMQELDHGFRYAFYSAHMSWASAFDTLKAGRILTLLRDPVSRCISQYRNFADACRIQEKWGAFPDGRELNGLLTKDPPASLSDALTSASPILRGHFCNVLTRSLLPFELDHDALAAGYFSERVLDLAIHNLSHNVLWFGMLDRIDQCLLTMCMSLGLPAMPFLDRKNVSAGSLKVSKSDRRMIEDMNLMDRVLFRHAEALYRDRWRAVNAEAVDSAFARNMQSRHAAAQVAGATRHRVQMVIPVERLAVPPGARPVEGGGRDYAFRWFETSSPAFILAGPGVPSRMALHVSMPSHDPRLPGLGAAIEDTAFRVKDVFPARLGAVVILERAGKADAVPEEWRTLRVSLRGRDEVIETRHGPLRFLVAVNRIEVTW